MNEQRQAVYLSRAEVSVVVGGLNRLLKEEWAGDRYCTDLRNRFSAIEGYWVEPRDVERENTFAKLTRGE